MAFRPGRIIADIFETTVLVLVAVVAFRALAFANYHIPSESMVPALRVGDRIMVSKYAYGYSRFSMPFGIGGHLPPTPERLFGHLPERGDVVVFKHPHTGDDYIKRVVGLPGDRVQVLRGRVHLNGRIVERKKVRAYDYRDQSGEVARVVEYRESFRDGEGHTILERTDRGAQDNTREFIVPAGHLFVMGDNRDNSSDSRDSGANGVGFVPLENVVGRAEFIAFTLNECMPEPGVPCHDGRFLSAIR
ncbi:MAG: signal peptidase I [Alphaproteobacteria bacterium]